MTSRSRPSRCAARSASNRCGGPTPTRRPRASSTCSAHGSAGSTRSGRSCGSAAPPWWGGSTPAPAASRAAMVQGFTGVTEVSMPLECTYDFEVAASKYLHALRDGAIPLLFLFSGTVFVQGERGFSVRQVSWECEAQHEMPVSEWNDLIRTHYPNAGWVRLGHDTVSALAAYKSARGMLDFEDAITTLLAEAP